MKNILFILKRREDYNHNVHNTMGLSTGLYNSAKFVNDMFNSVNISSVLEVVIDNNDIDRVVTINNPTHVIIEALWVVPSKFAILSKLHPNVKWIIRLHSELPFLASEGMAMDWIGDYADYPNIIIAANSPQMKKDIQTFLRISKNMTHKEIKEKVIYLPNYYPTQYNTKVFDKDKEYIDISCFGATRQLKNHLVQAIAAIKFADKINKKLRFHINSDIFNPRDMAVLHNLEGLFEHLVDSGHQLIQHQWMPRNEFLKLCSTMDIGLQCSFSETFNIVSADLVSRGVPILGSYEIPWSSKLFSTNFLKVDEIVDMLRLTYLFPTLNVKLNQYKLTRYTTKTQKIWVNYFGGK